MSSVAEKVMRDLNQLGAAKAGVLICILLIIVGGIILGVSDIEYVGPILLGVGIVGGFVSAGLWMWKSQDIDDQRDGTNVLYREEYNKIKQPHDRTWEYRRV